MKKKEIKSRLTLNKEVITNLNDIKGWVERERPVSEVCTKETCLRCNASDCNPGPNFTEEMSNADCFIKKI